MRSRSHSALTRAAGENFGLLCNGLYPALLLPISTGTCLLGNGTEWLLVSGVAPVLPY
jgi:hypothetical protein